jgi:hypothetical protein
MARASISPAQSARTTAQLIAAVQVKTAREVQAVESDVVVLQTTTAGLDVSVIDAKLADLDARVSAIEP